MVKCTLLLPTHDNDGKSLSYNVDRILEQLYFSFGGYTIREGKTIGTHRMSNNHQSVDTCTEMFVVIQPSQVDTLKKMVAGWCAELRQESLYFEKTLGTVEFIPPSTAGLEKAEKEKQKEKYKEAFEAAAAVCQCGLEAKSVAAAVAEAFGPTIGEFSAAFDGRDPEHNRLASIAEENRREQMDCAQDDPLRRASSIIRAVAKGGAQEFEGALPDAVVRHLRNADRRVRTYIHGRKTHTMVF